MIHTFRSSECPGADGKPPEPGDQKWTLSIPLEGGDDYLEVEIGKKGRAALRAMLEQEEWDDAQAAKSEPR